MENVKEYVEQFATFGNPVEYKGLKIKPILAEDAQVFLQAVEVFRIEKNRIPSVEIIRMSYLEFLITLMVESKDTEYFLWLLEKTLGMHHTEKAHKDGFDPDTLLFEELPNGDVFVYINDWDLEMKLRRKGGASIKIKDVDFTSKEFDDYRKIVLFQNIYDYDDIVLSDDVRRVVTQFYELKNKGIHMPTMEDKVSAVMLNTAYTLDDIKKLPLRTFEKLFHDGVNKIDYIATKSLEPHLKEGNSIDHWIYKPIREKYSEVFKDADAVAKKITSI